MDAHTVIRHILTLALACFASTTVLADTVQVAVASNFAGALEQIATAFARDTGHKAEISSGATGKFYAQIKNGAPFDVLLAADETTPAKLITEGVAQKGSDFTYAIGKLALWSAKPNYVDREGKILKTGNFSHLAVANPKTAPYGAAAMAVLKRMGLLEKLEPRFVQGENIAQTQQFITTGNAELGFVAVSQILKDGVLTSGSAWMIPENLHSPLRQNAALLEKAKDNEAAKALLKYLKSEPARKIIKSLGYEL